MLSHGLRLAAIAQSRNPTPLAALENTPRMIVAIARVEECVVILEWLLLLRNVTFGYMLAARENGDMGCMRSQRAGSAG